MTFVTFVLRGEFPRRGAYNEKNRTRITRVFTDKKDGLHLEGVVHLENTKMYPTSEVEHINILSASSAFYRGGGGAIVNHQSMVRGWAPITDYRFRLVQLR